jgi:tRNA pseudouridine55 synthase
LQAENQGTGKHFRKTMSVITESAGADSYPEGKILLFDKPYGWTSFDLVRKVRNTLTRTLKIKKLKVGHAGTLDPLATGLMVLCTGKATKRIESLQMEDKVYIATLKLGATTPSYDLETGEDELFPTGHITKALLEDVFMQFTGNIMQVPPVFSAVKIDGKRAYEHARKGNDPELKAKPVVIHMIELVSLEMPVAVIRVRCGKGTYIRSLARDLGVALNSGAYLTDLRRTQSGDYKVEEAYSIESFLKIMDFNKVNTINYEQYG